MTRYLGLAALTLAAALVVAAPAIEAYAQDTPEAASEETVTEYFSRWWSRMKSMTRLSSTGGSRTTAVAGLRGAKQDDEELAPYWKGDVGEGATPDQQAFEAIRVLVDKNDFAGAEKELIKFRQVHAQSPLRPHAELTLAMCQMQQKKSGDAKKTLNDFLADHADSDLAPQAKSMLQLLGD